MELASGMQRLLKRASLFFQCWMTFFSYLVMKNSALGLRLIKFCRSSFESDGRKSWARGRQVRGALACMPLGQEDPHPLQNQGAARRSLIGLISFVLFGPWLSEILDVTVSPERFTSFIPWWFVTAGPVVACTFSCYRAKLFPQDPIEKKKKGIESKYFLISGQST